MEQEALVLQAVEDVIILQRLLREDQHTTQQEDQRIQQEHQLLLQDLQVRRQKDLQQQSLHMQRQQHRQQQHRSRSIHSKMHRVAAENLNDSINRNKKTGALHFVTLLLLAL